MAKSKPKRLLMLALLLLTTAAAWAAATKQFPLYSGDEGTAAKPYQIKTVEDLIKLSDDVNSGTSYSGEYFKVMNNIDFNDAVDASLRPTTTWDDATSTESNFSGIGYYSHSFYGHFDGGGKTIKGIRIYDVEASSSHERNGFFGFIKDGAEVKNVTLDDTRITAYSSCGGIVGYISHSTVTGCTVTDHVAIHTVTDNSQYHGGIVGYSNGGTISNCISSATLTIVDGLTGCYYYGGIVGYCYNSSTVSDNLALSAIVPQSGNSCGAILGYYQNSTLAGNYYHNCTVAGIVNAVDAAFLGQDNEGARSIHMLTLNNGVTTTTAPSVTIGNDNYYFKGTTITLSITQPDADLGYIYDVYTVNNTPISGNTFTMPAEDTEVAAIPIYKLTLADGITTNIPPTNTVNNTSYYKEGTTVTLSGRPDAEEEGYAYPYMLNGVVFAGSTFTMPAQKSIVAFGEKTNDWQSVYAGTQDDPYKIYSTAQLNLIATRVNDGTNQYEGKYFRLMNDLHYAYATAWNDATSTEDNYTPIGYYNKLFKGTFDGNGNTISGIRIYQPNDDVKGIFGVIGGSAVVSGITIADARITCYTQCGGIVGRSDAGIVSNCHTTDNVTLCAGHNNAGIFGGVVGYNYHGAISFSTSAVTITIADGISGCYEFGGIAGANQYANMTDCRAIGAIVPAISMAGAIVGLNDHSTLSDNIYHSCLVGTDAFNIGVGTKVVATVPDVYGDISGEASLEATALHLFDGRDNTALIAAYANPSAHTANNGSAPDVSNIDVVLLGRTLYKDGDWNTLCLPFDIGNFEGTILEGATVKELDSSTSSLDDNGVLTLNFNTVTSISAGKPYIVKWESGSDIENPVFENVETNSSASTVVDFNGGSFVGTYNPFEITDANRNDILLLAAGNKLGYAKTDRTIANGKALGACRAYFHIPANGGSQAVRQYELDFGEETTGIEPLSFSPEGESTEASPRGGLVGASCFDLQGRRVLPLKKGVYIVNGRKVVIK